jgi:poly-gamma-glutamate capsule biosynthesis protein CapA/YwtB (metallophosphatase superfamily)
MTIIFTKEARIMSSIKIAAVGDILMWGNQIRSARISKDVYSFDYMFKEVKPLLKDADLTIGNLETTLSGRERYYQRVNSVIGGPAFNCPDELGETLKRSGFDVLTTANNHCMDRGIDGLKRTLDVLDKVGIYHTGTFRSLEESRTKLIINIKGIKIGIIACTYGTNGYELGPQEAWAVNYIDEQILSQVYDIKKQVDLTIVCLHMGREFTDQLIRAQRYWVQKLFEHGADIILGAHPHVIQPMSLKKVKDLDSIEKDRFVIYSLGDFISDILWDDIYSITGMILNLEVVKNDEGNVAVTNVEYIPTWVSIDEINNQEYFVLLPMSKYLKSSKSTLSADTLENMKKAWDHAKALLGGKAK